MIHQIIYNVNIIHVNIMTFISIIRVLLDETWREVTSRLD